MVIDRRIPQHHMKICCYSMDEEIRCQPPINTNENTIDSVEQQVALVKRNVVFLDLQQPEPDAANRGMYQSTRR